MSTSSRASESVLSLFQVSSLSLICLISVIIRPARAPSFQKPGSAVSSSFSAIFFSMAAASKTPPDIENLLAERDDGSCDVVEHYVLQVLARALLSGTRGSRTMIRRHLLSLRTVMARVPVDRELVQTNRYRRNR